MSLNKRGPRWVAMVPVAALLLAARGGDRGSVDERLSQETELDTIRRWLRQRASRGASRATVTALATRRCPGC
jgi:hypothetical protein